MSHEPFPWFLCLHMLLKLIHNNSSTFRYRSSSPPVCVKISSHSHSRSQKTFSVIGVILTPRQAVDSRHAIDTRETTSVVLSCRHGFSMASKRKSTLISRDTISDDAADMNTNMSITTGLGPLQTSKQLKTLASTSKDTTTDDTDGEDFTLSITRGHEPLRRLKRSKISAPSSESDDNSPLGLADTNFNSVELDIAQGHPDASVSLANKPQSMRPIEGTSRGTGYSELPQLKSVTTYPSQSPHHHQREKSSTSRVVNNRPLDPPSPLSQGPATITPNNGVDHSNLTLPKTASLTEHTSDCKSSEMQKQEEMRLLELPLDVLCLVADHLDIVARACLRYAHPALGSLSKNDPGNLSLCARSRIVSLLQRDDVSIPKELLGVAKKGNNEGECSEYHEVVPKHCVICRCDGHLSYCPGCRIRTCAREDTEFWRKWTGIVDDDTTFLAGAMHPNP